MKKKLAVLLLLMPLLLLKGCNKESDVFVSCMYKEGDHVVVKQDRWRVQGWVERVSVINKDCWYLVQVKDTFIYPKVVWVHEKRIW
jgi:hypothetical protein